jgi:hypothetical protein
MMQCTADGTNIFKDFIYSIQTTKPMSDKTKELNNILFHKIFVILKKCDNKRFLNKTYSIFYLSNINILLCNNDQCNWSTFFCIYLIINNKKKNKYKNFSL